jgi:hypothetical protein
MFFRISLIKLVVDFRRDLQEISNSTVSATIGGHSKMKSGIFSDVANDRSFVQQLENITEVLHAFLECTVDINCFETEATDVVLTITEDTLSRVDVADLIEDTTTFVCAYNELPEQFCDPMFRTECIINEVSTESDINFHFAVNIRCAEVGWACFTPSPLIQRLAFSDISILE